MVNLWLKIKIWTKIILFTLLLLYFIVFIFENANKELKVWVWFRPPIETTLLQLIPALLIGGAIATIICRMAYRAFNQIRELQKRNSDAKLQQDMEDIRAKAAMLQTKPPVATEAASPQKQQI